MLNWRLENTVPATLPGNPELIAQFAARYDRMAEALNQAVEELTNLANEGVSISLAVDEVRDRAQESISTTRKVAIRYEGASQTLNSYQSALGDAIQSANAARDTINTNNPSAGYWRRRERDLELQRLVDPTNNTLIEDLQEANRWVTEYDNDYLSAIQAYNNAVTARDNAVNSAIAGLNDAAESAGLNDNFWEAIEGTYDAFYDLAQKYLAPLVEILRDVLEVLKKIVDILALIVTVLAIFIPVLAPLAAALTVISLVLAAAILLCSLVLFALGKETLGRVIGDVIDLAVGVITAKLGGIKFTSVAGDLASAGSTMAREGFEQATSYVIRTEAEKFAADTATEMALEFASAGPSAFADTNNMHISDFDFPPGVNVPWGSSPFDMGEFYPSYGENVIDALLPNNPVSMAQFAFDHGYSSAESGIEFVTNVTNVTAVPAG